MLCGVFLGSPWLRTSFPHLSLWEFSITDKGIWPETVLKRKPASGILKEAGLENQGQGSTLRWHGGRATKCRNGAWACCPTSGRTDFYKFSSKGQPRINGMFCRTKRRGNSQMRRPMEPIPKGVSTQSKSLQKIPALSHVFEPHRKKKGNSPFWNFLYYICNFLTLPTPLIPGAYKSEQTTRLLESVFP